MGGGARLAPCWSFLKLGVGHVGIHCTFLPEICWDVSIEKRVEHFKMGSPVDLRESPWWVGGRRRLYTQVGGGVSVLRSRHLPPPPQYTPGVIVTSVDRVCVPTLPGRCGAPGSADGESGWDG